VLSLDKVRYEIESYEGSCVSLAALFHTIQPTRHPTETVIQVVCSHPSIQLIMAFCEVPPPQASMQPSTFMDAILLVALVTCCHFLGGIRKSPG